MGLMDRLRQGSGDISPEVTRTIPAAPSPVRKKGTFDIAFLTGQSEDRERSRNQSEESCSGGSSDSSIIDILTDSAPPQIPSRNNLERKKRKRKVNDAPETNFASEKSAKFEIQTFPGSELIIPQLTSPFNFLPQLKSGPLGQFVPFSSDPPSSSANPTCVNGRRGIFGHSSAEPPHPIQHHPQFYQPYHPFLISPKIPPQVETANQNPGSHQSTTQSPPLTTSTLLPPSLAALSLPAQNVCAKCKIGFRMTSDLVYHMRSHHKRETDPQQKRREEKLKCPVCHETFRERHHLTRHMTAHQDREEELEFKTGKV